MKVARSGERPGYKMQSKSQWQAGRPTTDYGVHWSFRVRRTYVPGSELVLDPHDLHDLVQGLLLVDIQSIT